jgi:hypothetical protein
MTTPAMTALASLVTIATAAAEPLTRATEVPELASMALLSVVLAGVSVAVRRSGSRDHDAEPRERREPRDTDRSASAPR